MISRSASMGSIIFATNPIIPMFRDETSFCYKLHLPPSTQKTAMSLIEKVEDELENKRSGYRTLCMACFYELVVLLCRSSEEDMRGKRSDIALNVKHEVVSQAIAFIESRADRKISLSEMARSVHLSESGLSHLFKEETGLSPFEYLIRVRIDRACEMLKESKKNITEIAFSVGFHDASYFSKTFKKITGSSPTKYRRAISS